MVKIARSVKRSLQYKSSNPELFQDLTTEIARDLSQKTGREMTVGFYDPSMEGMMRGGEVPAFQITTVPFNSSIGKILPYRHMLVCINLGFYGGFRELGAGYTREVEEVARPALESFALRNRARPILYLFDKTPIVTPICTLRFRAKGVDNRLKIVS